MASDSIESVDQHNICFLFAQSLTLLAKWSPILGENLTVLPQTTAFPGFDALKRKRSRNTIPAQCIVYSYMNKTYSGLYAYFIDDLIF
jgi:hypothetical protein